MRRLKIIYKRIYDNVQRVAEQDVIDRIDDQKLSFRKWQMQNSAEKLARMHPCRNPLTERNFLEALQVAYDNARQAALKEFETKTSKGE